MWPFEVPQKVIFEFMLFYVVIDSRVLWYLSERSGWTRSQACRRPTSAGRNRNRTAPLPSETCNLALLDPEVRKVVIIDLYEQRAVHSSFAFTDASHRSKYRPLTKADDCCQKKRSNLNSASILFKPSGVSIVLHAIHVQKLALLPPEVLNRQLSASGFTGEFVS